MNRRLFVLWVTHKDKLLALLLILNILVPVALSIGYIYSNGLPSNPNYPDPGCSIGRLRDC